MSDFMHILYILFLTYFRGILTFILLFLFVYKLLYTNLVLFLQDSKWIPD